MRSSEKRALLEEKDRLRARRDEAKKRIKEIDARLQTEPIRDPVEPLEYQMDTLVSFRKRWSNGLISSYFAFRPANSYRWYLTQNGTNIKAQLPVMSWSALVEFADGADINLHEVRTLRIL